MVDSVIDLLTAHPKWRLDGPALSGHLLYSLVNHAYANRYRHLLYTYRDLKFKNYIIDKNLTFNT